MLRTKQNGWTSDCVYDSELTDIDTVITPTFIKMYH